MSASQVSRANTEELRGMVSLLLVEFGNMRKLMQEQGVKVPCKRKRVVEPETNQVVTKDTDDTVPEQDEPNEDEDAQHYPEPENDDDGDDHHDDGKGGDESEEEDRNVKSSGWRDCEDEDKKAPCEPLQDQREIYNSTTHRKEWMTFSRRMDSQGANFPEMSKLWTGSRDATHRQCKTACSGFYAAFRP